MELQHSKQGTGVDIRQKRPLCDDNARHIRESLGRVFDVTFPFQFGTLDGC